MPLELPRARRALLRWYRVHRRELPWRATRDPYAVWISESMLQQTRVETVLGYWAEFLLRFPTVEALATATLEDVFAAWAGLGYYSRARNLHRAAREIMERFDARVPEDVDALRSLPGIGRYTAGAIASIAFDRPAPILDGNVERVLVRWLALRGDPKAKAASARLWTLAAAFAEGTSPGDLNQALMELGALVCTPGAPRCEACPIRATCEAHARGETTELPMRAAKRPPRRVRAAAAWLERGGRVLLVRRPPGGLLGGLFELPGVELARDTPAEPALRDVIRARVGLEVDELTAAGHIAHAFTHRTLRLELFCAKASSARVRLDGWVAHRWCGLDEIDAIAESRLLHKAIAHVRGARRGS